MNAVQTTMKQTVKKENHRSSQKQFFIDEHYLGNNEGTTYKNYRKFRLVERNTFTSCLRIQPT